MFLPHLYHRDWHESHSYETAWVFLPLGQAICDNCGGPDPLGGGGMDINCPSCNGTGYIFAYARNKVRVRIMNSKPDMVYLSGLVGTAPMGEYVLVGEYRDKAIYDAAIADPLAYIVIDGTTKIKPVTLAVNRTQGPVSVEVECKRVGVKDRE